MDVSFSTYYNNEHLRTKIRVPSPSLMTSQLSRQRGYAMRACYEYKYCKDNNGVAYFATFTYNDSSVINLSLNGFNYGNFCNNKSFRLFLVNYLYKKVQRLYNCRFTYFCTGELGEGKGKRGYANNPHFHVIFYLYPIDSNSLLPTEAEFFTLLRDYWQGKDISDKQRYRYGIVSGSKGRSSVINSDDAIQYVSKYVTKDDNYFSKSCKLRQYIVDYFLQLHFTSDDLFYRELDFLPHFHKYWRKCSIIDISTLNLYLQQVFFNFYDDTDTSSIDDVTDIAFKYLSNYLLPKTLLSQGLGLYGNTFVTDWHNPKLPYKTGHGIVNFPIPLYLYRKQFYEVEYFKVTDRYLIVLNRTHYKPNQFYIDIKKDELTFTKNFVSFCSHLYNDIRCFLNVPLSNLVDFLNTRGVFVEEFQQFKNLRFFGIKDIKLSDIYVFHGYYSLFFGRDITPYFVDFDNISNSNLLSYFYNYHCKFLDSLANSYRQDFKLPAHVCNKTLEFFSPYALKFSLINLILTYKQYFKNDDIYKKNSEWRKIRRSHFYNSVQGSS